MQRGGHQGYNKYNNRGGRGGGGGKRFNKQYDNRS